MSPRPKKSAPRRTSPSEEAVREVKRRTCLKFSSEEKIRIVLEGLRGEMSIAELCRIEEIHANQYNSWLKEFLEAGKKRLQAIPSVKPVATKSSSSSVKMMSCDVAYPTCICKTSI